MTSTLASHRRGHLRTPSRRTALAALALVSAAGLALTGPVMSAFGAAGGTVSVQTSQTVKADLTNTGKLDSGHVFTQVAVTGKGAVVVKNPTSTQGLRNLNGWGSPSTENGKTVYNVKVDGGSKTYRTVANFTKDLPVSVAITYRLDGRKISPDDLAGKSGRLGVSYTIKNTTAEPTEITYPDGHGKDVTESVDLVTPYVGQLSVALPSSFKRIGSDNDRADQAGDGHGGRLLTWTMVLFEPIGQTVQRFGYTAQVDDIAIPPASIQLVPVSPENHPELKFGQDGFSAGAQSGRDVTDAGVQIDDNLLKLQAGATKLLAGLTQLQEGSATLASGLVSGADAAIPGSQQLAAGAQTAADGSTQVADGADQVAAGNAKLAKGLNQLAGGAAQLSTGADQLSTGFNDPNSDSDLIDGSQSLASGLGLILAGINGLPESVKANDGYKQIQGALAGIVAAIGNKNDPFINGGKVDPKTLNAAINAIEFGLTNPGCVKTDPLNTANPCGFKEALNILQFQLSTPGSEPTQNTSLATLAALNVALSNAGGKQALEYLYGPNGLDCGQPSPLASVNPALAEQCTKVTRSVNNLALGPGNPAFFLTTAEPEVTNNIVQGIVDKLGTVSDTQTAVGLLALLQQKINAQSGTSYAAGTLFFGLEGVRLGLTNPNCNRADPTNPTNPCGIKEVTQLVSAGIDQLVAGIAASLSAVVSPASTGAGDLADGIATAGDGAAQLSAGLKQVGAKVPAAVDGADQLADGSEKVAAGANQLADGLNNQLAPGAEQLAAGLGSLTQAADGAQQLSDGLTQAEDGNQKIVDGTGELSKRGSKKLIAAGDDTARTFARQYAIMKALDTKGAKNAMPYGTPTGSQDNRAAYDLTIASVGHTGTTNNPGRGVIALIVLGAGAFLATSLRGRFA